MNVGKVLLKLVKMAVIVADTAFKVSDQMEKNRVPVCGAYEAYSRRERGEISREDFIEATMDR